MSLAAADIFEPGSRALALAREAWGGRGFFTSVRRPLPDGSWLGPADARELASLSLVELPYTFGEPEEERHQRLLSVPSSASVLSLLPVPSGEPQGLDTIGFFAACRMALPRAHLVVDLELLGQKLGQLCLSFGADTVVGNIVNQRELRLGPRASSNELTRDEAARLLRAAGFVPCEALPGGEVRAL